MGTTSQQNISIAEPVRAAERVREFLRLSIQQGRWQNELPSERHLSTEFNISRPTLRIAIWSLASEGMLVRQQREPCKIVPRSTRRVGRNPARNREVILLHDGRSKPDTTSTAILVREIQRRLHPLGFGVRLANAVPTGAKGIPRALERIDSDCRPSFYVAVSVPAAVHAWLAQRDIPCIVAGSRSPDLNIPAVEVDQEVTFEHAVNHLVRHGHRRIGLLQVPISSIGAALGSEAFLRACRRLASLGVQGQIQVTVARPVAVENAVRKIFAQPHPPTAMIFADLELGVSLYTTLGSLGITIPQQVSVLSTADWPLLHFLRPEPTCYQLPWETLAARIVKLIKHYQRLGVWPHSYSKLLPKLRSGESIATVSPERVLGTFK